MTRRQDKAALRPRAGLLSPDAERDTRLLDLLLGQEKFRAAIADGAIVQLKASADEQTGALFPHSAVVDLNSGDSRAALEAVQSISGDVPLLLLLNALQFMPETRQFLGECFAKVALAGILVIAVPHQFMYERKWKLPSRRNPMHRRFYTAGTLLADIEEALDPCEFRVRFLTDFDEDYDYRAELGSPPDGAQDIVVLIERIARPAWRQGLDRDEIWTRPATRPIRFLEIISDDSSKIRTVAPDPGGVHRVAIIKLDHRGDFLLANDAFRILRETFRFAEITLICGSWNVGQARSSGFFDEVVAFDFFPEDDSARLELQPRETLVRKFAREMSGRSFDLAVDLRLYDDTRGVLKALKARNRAGFDRLNDFPWLTIRLNLPSATEDDRAEQGGFPADRFSTSICKHLSYEIRRDVVCRSEGWRTIVWGPYLELKPGQYVFECLMEPLADSFDAPYDIVFDKGRQVLSSGVLAISRERRPQIHVHVEKRIDEFEFRLLGMPGYDLQPFRFFGLRYVRPSIIRGVHQSEGMALLAHLIQMRLANAYTTEVD
jgi:hypothetical protein